MNKALVIGVLSILILSGGLSGITLANGYHTDDPVFYDHLGGFPDVIFEETETILIEPSTVMMSSETTSLINGMIWQIDEALVSQYITALANMGPRVTGSSACAAAGTYIASTFSSFGLTVRQQPWTRSGYTGTNIEGVLPGSDPESDQIYVVCGHYDSVPGSPGADDNAAGTAAVIAAAQVLSNYEFNHTLYFVAFDGEEQGLHGSRSYAEEAANNLVPLTGALNADMIGYADTPDDASKIKIYTNSASLWMYSLTSSVATQYADQIALTTVNMGTASNSDHYSFWINGYDAIMYHEYKFNPYYHSSQDTIDKMDLHYDMRVTRLITATLATMAEPIPGGGGNGGGDGGTSGPPPTVRINYPFDGDEVNGMVTISGIAFDPQTYVKEVLIKLGDSRWLSTKVTQEGNGGATWSYVWDTTKSLDGSVLIAAVALDSQMHSSGVHYAQVTVKNTPDPPKIPDLNGYGSFSWTEVEPGGIRTGLLSISNCGDEGSSLNWRIDIYPEWGEWTFTPDNGLGLTPEESDVVISVSVIAPEVKEQNFTGFIRIINIEDSTDEVVIPVYLATPKHVDASLVLQRLLQRFPFLGRFMQLFM